MSASKVIMIVLVSTYGCKLDNIDNAEPATVPFDSMEECQPQADIIDAKQGVRAFCLDVG